VQHARLDIDHLLKISAIEFAKHGFEGVSMRSLADLCSVTQPALYYHFSSKEALYEEVCSRKFDEIAQLVANRVAQADTAEEKLLAFVGALYDEWHRDNTLLLLTQREVMLALIDPHQCMAATHYTFLMGLIPNILARHLGRAIDDDFVFTFGSLLFGYCSLMSFDQLGKDMSRGSYLEHRKKVLLGHVKKLWGALAVLS
jgi:AcrR family transcriptional regulator